MMKTFLREVVEKIFQNDESFENTVFILPSKRAGVFLRKDITSFLSKPTFSPKIVTVEELIADISKLEAATNFDLLISLYEAFLPEVKDEGTSFETFIAWGNTLLSDFNEIDRNLIDAKALFNFLIANQRLNNWGITKEPTPLIAKNLKFWGDLETVYHRFRNNLLEKGIGYQGLLYRKAVVNITSYLNEQSELTKFHFVGFNALNTAEEELLQAFLNNNKTTIWWDLDSHFLKDNIHEAGFFIRKYLKKWPVTKSNFTSGTSFLENKNIQIIGAPKSIAQAKLSGTLLKKYQKKTEEQQVAIVLSDEGLLNPILHALPEVTAPVNITMGLPLQKTVLFGFFETLFNLYINKTQNGWFYKDVIAFLSNPYAIKIGDSEDVGLTQKVIATIREKNIFTITEPVLKASIFPNSNFLKSLFTQKECTSSTFIDLSLVLIKQLKVLLQRVNAATELHQLYGFYQLFNQLATTTAKKSYLKSLKALHMLFNELVSAETIDFKGDPISGLQIMGVLESRNLDFETVIITSVNEGILPAGKSQNSFIPFDIKKEFGLPTYKEKDAIYAYHFYRLLQRAKNIYIIYNTEPDVLLGNEKSRFISQLLMDSAITNTITHTIAAPNLQVKKPTQKEVTKTDGLLSLLEAVALKGFSPSSLSNYIKNPYRFYKNNVLRLNEVQHVEESIAYNTFGTIIHDALEELYLPLVGKTLSKDNLTSLKVKIKKVTQEHFTKHYPPKSIESGQNLIAFHVVQKYISSVIDLDLLRSKSQEIVILALEQEIKTELSIPNITFPVYIKGKLDRLERVNGQTSILDYKTGNASSSEVEIIEVDMLLESDKRLKAFQLLCYALMEHKKHGSAPLVAGIVPIKTLSAGILFFSKKSAPRGPKNPLIDTELLAEFENTLASLISEILNPNIPFTDSDSEAF